MLLILHIKNKQWFHNLTINKYQINNNNIVCLWPIINLDIFIKMEIELCENKVTELCIFNFFDFVIDL